MSITFENVPFFVQNYREKMSLLNWLFYGIPEVKSCSRVYQAASCP
jgi:hypothetical protein